MHITIVTNYKNKCSFSAVVRNHNNGGFECGKKPKLFSNVTYMSMENRCVAKSLYLQCDTFQSFQCHEETEKPMRKHLQGVWFQLIWSVV